MVFNNTPSKILSHWTTKWSTSQLRARLVPLNRFKPSSKIFLLTVRRGHFFCGSFMLFLSCVCCAFVRVCLLSPCGHLLGKGWPLGSRLWCLFVSLLLSWVRCGTWLYRFLIFAILRTYTYLIIFNMASCHWGLKLVGQYWVNILWCTVVCHFKYY